MSSDGGGTSGGGGTAGIETTIRVVGESAPVMSRMGEYTSMWVMGRGI